jgi:hypothetical protein
MDILASPCQSDRLTADNNLTTTEDIFMTFYIEKFYYNLSTHSSFA